MSTNTNTTTNITEQEYQELRGRIDRFNTWLDTLRKRTRCRKCRGTGFHRGIVNPVMHVCQNCAGKGYTLGACSYREEDVPEHLRADKVGNAELSRVEVYEFMRDKPGRYFAYVAQDLSKVTTWTGETLGYVIWHGNPYKVRNPFSHWPSERQNLRVHAVNGLTYSAVYYKSSGDYCRMKVVSSSKGGIR